MKIMKLSLSLFALSYAMFVLPAANDGSVLSKSEQKILDKIETILNEWGPATENDGSLWKGAILRDLRSSPKPRITKKDLEESVYSRTLLEILQTYPSKFFGSKTLSEEARNALLMEMQTRQSSRHREEPIDRSESDTASSFIGSTYSGSMLGFGND